jgi:TetR/AcrR family fatty acid metabolism transcriptional regulator
MSVHSLTAAVPPPLREVAISSKNRSSDKYHRILESAVKVFAAQGFHQATISLIAKEAGVADGTIYLYFKNKDDILVHFFDFRARQVFDRFREAVDRAQGAVAKLRALIRCQLEEFGRDRDMAVVYQAEMHSSSRVAETQIREMARTYGELVSQIVEMGQEEGCMRRDLFMGLVKRFILGTVHEVIGTWLHSGASYELASMADPLVELFIRGIGGGHTAAAASTGPAASGFQTPYKRRA